MFCIHNSGQLTALLREANWFSIVLRLSLAIIFGGIVGIERGRKGRPAGFRTHMLVCLGSALTVLTNQYMIQYFGNGDPARLGAQVINGIGFLGVGTIIVTGKHKVKGLTTAAGLWASACMGLALGIGFYEAGLVACLLIVVVTSALHWIDTYIAAQSKEVELYLELGMISDISNFVGKMQLNEIQVSGINITRNANTSDSSVSVMVLLQSEQKRDRTEMLTIASDIPGVKFAEVI